MAQSVAQLLSRLRFAGGPVEALYLNEIEFMRTLSGNSAH